MTVQLEMKNQKKREEEEMKKRENEQYLSYIKELDSRDEAVKKVKQEK